MITVEPHAALGTSTGRHRRRAFIVLVAIVVLVVGVQFGAVATQSAPADSTSSPSPTVSPQPEPEPEPEGGGFGLGLAIGLFAGALIGAMGAAGIVQLRRSGVRRGNGDARQAQPSAGTAPQPGQSRASIDEDPAPAPTHAVEPTTGAAGVKREIISGLVATYDIATDDAQRERIESTLMSAGVRPIMPKPGDQFDPAWHQAIDARTADRERNRGTIAGIIRPGWTTATEVVRFAEVIVHR